VAKAQNEIKPEAGNRRNDYGLQHISSIFPAAIAEGLSSVAAKILDPLNNRAFLELGRIGLTNEFAGKRLAKAKANFLENLGLCESPIEQAMFCCLCHMLVPELNCFPPVVHDIRDGSAWPHYPVVIAPQFTIARYRLDFAVQINDGEFRQLIAVECDGADHHASIEDREKDKNRDAYLLALGIPTIRYTGQWIYRNGYKVADEIAAICNDRRKHAA
jgi:very-short-patch-repair endonuclease